VPSGTFLEVLMMVRITMTALALIADPVEKAALEKAVLIADRVEEAALEKAVLEKAVLERIGMKGAMAIP